MFKFMDVAATALIVGLSMFHGVAIVEIDARRARHHAEQVSQEALVWNHTERPLLLLHTTVRNSPK
jgi:hypothetical protein